MTFIGVVSQKEDFYDIEQNINNNLLKKNSFININSENIESIKNVKFETVLILDIKSVREKLQYLKIILKQCQYILINTDAKENLKVLEDINSNVITFGFNNKSTITASSIEGENILICIQRSILNKNKQEIEPQEIKISVKNKNNIYKIMGIIGILALYSKQKMEKFYKI